MRPTRITRNVAGLFSVLALIVSGSSGCGTTTIIRQMVIVGATASPSAAETATPTPVPKPPPGIWCLVKQGQMSLAAACELFSSALQMYNPPQGESVLAGRFVGPGIGEGVSNSVTERMTSPWTADVDCATSDDSDTGRVRILMVAHSSSGDFYSWGNKACGPPAAPSYGQEYFRKATVTVTLSIQPLTGNLGYWQAQLIQL